MSKLEIKIVIPVGVTTSLDYALVELTRFLVEDANQDREGGLFGGEFGYGATHENDVFLMHPYCWCERDDCAWCSGCRCEGYWDTPERKYERGAEWTVTAECDWCKGAEYGQEKGGESDKGAPNFWYKPTGFKVWWYKWIGRSQEISGDVPRLGEMLRTCMESVDV